MITWIKKTRNRLEKGMSVRITIIRAKGKKFVMIYLRNGLDRSLFGKKYLLGYDDSKKRLYFKESENGYKVTNTSGTAAIRIPAFDGAGEFLGDHEWRYDSTENMNYIEVDA